MKKIIVLIIILWSYSQLQAQFFRTGLISGISGAQVEGDGFGGYKKLGFVVGGYAGFDLAEKWSTQFEIYYIGKGSRKNPHPDKGDYRYFKLNLNYIEIPVVLRYHYQKFRFEMGFYYGVLLNHYIEDEYGVRFTQNYPFKKGDFGGLIGVSYQLNEHFSCNLRSKNSIVPIRDFQNKDANIGILNKLFNRGWYNVDLNFTLRYHFGGNN
ncbi:MAG: PorT family protein [Vicingus serpentipes]|nr:PorT family protein [Vicingus serpentipes]